MSLTLFNTLSNKKESFEPLTKGVVKIYNCGPTVYDYAHIGNFRTVILYDLLRRTLEWDGFKVEQVMNITDVDDKTIKRSQVEKISLEELTKKYEVIFWNDLASLNILKPHQTPRATEYVKEMIEFIDELLKKGVAYTSDDGVYFAIRASDGYGKLAGLVLDAPTKERIQKDEYDKENARDFALWKFYTPDDGDVVFDAHFGKGRPGWHIECSAMSRKTLGDTLDIHTGGVDLIFPHHTNEIAQSESANGKTFSRFWIHGAFITVDGKKMSKSLGNIFTLETLRERHISPIVYRYFVLGAHYRNPLNFTWDALEGCENAYKRLVQYYVSFGDTLGVVHESYRQKFDEYINDDLDMPKALALAWELLKDDLVSPADKKATLRTFDSVFGLDLEGAATELKKQLENIPIPVKNLATERENARKLGDFKRSDELRAEIHKLGFTVEDTGEGPRILPR